MSLLYFVLLHLPSLATPLVPFLWTDFVFDSRRRRLHPLLIALRPSSLEVFCSFLEPVPVFASSTPVAWALYISSYETGMSAVGDAFEGLRKLPFAFFRLLGLLTFENLTFVSTGCFEFFEKHRRHRE